jgi:hypothetical protein
MLSNLIDKYRNKHQYETNELLKEAYAEIASDLKELRGSLNTSELNSAKESLVKELEIMDRRDSLERLGMAHIFCKKCGIEKNALVPSAGGGALCRECV